MAIAAQCGAGMGWSLTPLGQLVNEDGACLTHSGVDVTLAPCVPDSAVQQWDLDGKQVHTYSDR